MKEHTILKECVDALCEALETEPDFRMSWQANIAMAFVDEWDKDKKTRSLNDVHGIANLAADRFLTMLCQTGSKPVGDK